MATAKAIHATSVPQSEFEATVMIAMQIIRITLFIILAFSISSIRSSLLLEGLRQFPSTALFLVSLRWP
jgi:hypothetical protein